jgi:hypothetical protein
MVLSGRTGCYVPHRQSKRAGVARERAVERPELGVKGLREHHVRRVVRAAPLETQRRRDRSRTVDEPVERHVEARDRLPGPYDLIGCSWPATTARVSAFAAS